MLDCKANDDGKVYIRGPMWYREAAGATGEPPANGGGFQRLQPQLLALSSSALN